MGRDTITDPRIFARLTLCLLIIGSAFAGIKEVIPMNISIFASLLFLAILNLWNGYETLMAGRTKQARFLWLSGVVALVISFVSLF